MRKPILFLSAVLMTAVLFCTALLPADARSGRTDIPVPDAEYTETFLFPDGESLFRAVAEERPDYRSGQEIDFSVSYEFYDQLDTEDQRSLYNQLWTATPANPACSVLSTSLGPFSSSDYPDASAVYNAIRDDARCIVVSAYAAFCLDHPEVLFWSASVTMSLSLSRVYTETDFYYYLTIGMKPAVADGFSADTYETMKADMQAVYDSIPTNGSNRYEILKSFHDDLCNLFTYVSGAQYAHSAYAVVDGEAVCEGYSLAMKTLCNRANIPCIYMTGNAY
ncbi:MAG: hypothetical protein ILO68_02115, partial [Clostridia bacterium]|nr:hypothetical protein [Clostridia bacterium]